jgi:polyhydroxyalkanoate synthase
MNSLFGWTREGIDLFHKYLDPFGIATSLLEVEAAWLQRPQELASQLDKLANDLVWLEIASWRRIWGIPADDQVPAVEHDIRFQDPAWTEVPALDVLKQHYLLFTHWLGDTVFNTPGVDEKTRRRAGFWLRQFLDAVAPSNVFWTNPAAVRRFLDTGGLSLAEGGRRWIEHLRRGDLPMAETDAFRVGGNLATTPGQVVFRNGLMELIQYAPTTQQVRQIPVVIFAPWINKYYILDLEPQQSLVRWLVGQGFTVFVTSWKNPTPAMRDTAFEDYLLQGVLPALDAARAICGVSRVHAVGYCIGGTLLASYMAWQAHEPESERRIAHWTLLATLTDFASPGDIEVFINKDSVAWIEQQMALRGYLDGGEIAWSFRLLRPNHLVWNYAVQYYLYGEDPVPFDVLYWNMDSTRLPARMHSYYLREFYLANRLVIPDALVLAGHPLDLSRITEPLYAVGTEQDHIAPWKETYKVLALIRSEARYVLATSGHILGIISPPVDSPKRRYWAAPASGQRDPEAWRKEAPKLPGSWWEDWSRWLGDHCDDQVEPPPLGGPDYPLLGPAPGTYVLEQ